MAVSALWRALVDFVRRLGLALLVRLFGVAHPTNESGNNMSQR